MGCNKTSNVRALDRTPLTSTAVMTMFSVIGFARLVPSETILTCRSSSCVWVKVSPMFKRLPPACSVKPSVVKFESTI